MAKKRVIAIHLPQFYPFKENDEWWGKGFTEWRNVAAARPRFKSHYQPHIPRDLSFYDLRLKESRIAQQLLAKEYGIDGFCYYHYWFNGKLIMEKPLELMLSDKEEAFPYMLCWANGSWVRNWEGKNNTILIEQKYSYEDDIAHFKYLLPFFKDPRYISVNGKPVFGIHRADSIEELEKRIETWQELAAKEGFQLYMFRFESAGKWGPEHLSLAMDAAVEFQPFNMGQFWKTHNFIPRLFEKVLNKPLTLYFSYKDYVNFKCKELIRQDYKLYPCVFPSWDNSPRRVNRPYMAFTESTPALFKKWFEHVYGLFKPYSEEENFVFINAWNEWAESCHLEPDMKFGLGYLEAVQSVVDTK